MPVFSGIIIYTLEIFLTTFHIFDVRGHDHDKPDLMESDNALTLY